MPRGISRNGMRMTKNRQALLAAGVSVAEIMSGRRISIPTMMTPRPVAEVPQIIQQQDETEEQIEARIKERFDVLGFLTESCIAGDSRSLIVSGPAGLGKSFIVEKTLSDWGLDEDGYTIVKGFVRATGLYKLLYQHRNPGRVLVFDDADSIFFDDVSLNLLKAVCDTTEQRVASWLAETNMVDEESATPLPRRFDFNGTIIFITNLDFDAMIDKGNKLAPHFEALMSRSHYVDLAIKTKRDYLVRIKQVIREGMLSDMEPGHRADVIRFLEENSHRLRELSLRTALKIATIRKTGTDNWERVASVTCCRSA